MAQVRLPRPLPHQAEVLAADARLKVVVCGRRWGKSALGLIAVLCGHGPGRRYRGAAQGARGFWVAPTYGIASEIWRDLKAACGGAWEDKSESERRIVLPGGGSVSVRSADNPDNLRGVGLDFLVIDEAAFVAEEAWTEVLRPTLADRQGWAVFISTPKGINWFHDLYQRAGTTPGWTRWQRPTAENPRIPAAELEASRLELGSFVYSQEFLAEFVTPGAGLFRREWLRYYRREGDWLTLDDGRREHVGNLRRYATVDLAASVKTTADYTVVQVWGESRSGDKFLLDQFRARVSGPELVPTIRRVALDAWACDVVWIESVGFQLALVDQARAAGIPVRELPRDKDKIARALAATPALEAGSVWLPKSVPWLEDLESELLSFPNGAHDDQVDALSDGVCEGTERGAFVPVASHLPAAPASPLAGLLPATPRGW